MAAPLTVGRVRLRSGADPDRARLRLERALAGADLLPPGLGPAAILVVRGLRDPLPGGLDPQRELLAAPAAWERAARRATERAAAQAARPAEGPVPAAAGAVLFADSAELLACLARDWAAGELGAWWWRAARPAVSTLADLRRELLAEPQQLPAAFERLVAWGASDDLLGGLGPAGSAELLGGLLDAFGLRDLATALGSPGGTTPAAVATGPPPWAEAAPEAAAAPSGRAGQALLGVALSLQRTRAAVRSPAFAAAAAAWSGAGEGAGAGGGAAHGARPPARRRPGRRRSVGSRRGSAGRAAAARRRARATPAPSPPCPPTHSIETEVGGVLHLLVVAVDLGLYGDFTEPAKPGIALDPWDFLVLAGQRLLVDPRPDDPLWALLAELAGRRPEQPPGAGFKPSRGWGPRPLERWADGIAADLRARLRVALGVEDEARIASLLLVRRAKLEATAARVDVHFSLAQLPIEVRLAGLDRDPGFLPAAGRSIAFHFA